MRGKIIIFIKLPICLRHIENNPCLNNNNHGNCFVSSQLKVVIPKYAEWIWRSLLSRISWRKKVMDLMDYEAIIDMGGAQGRRASGN